MTSLSPFWGAETFKLELEELGWRLSMPGHKASRRWWSCPSCAEYDEHRPPVPMSREETSSSAISTLRLARAKFLILEGPSRFGKTRFACDLFGANQTCVINCQGVQQPYLARYDAARHKAIVLDEPSAELVGRCKVFLQAGLDGCELYQSATQRYTRWYCVFNVPLIICTND